MKVKPPHMFIMSEVSNLHEGSVGLAKQIIAAAVECGVDAVKFQTHIFEAESCADAPNPPFFSGESRRSYLTRTAFTFEQYKELKAYTEKLGVEFISSPFSIEAIDLLDRVGLKTFKVPSGEVSNIPYLIHLAKTGKKVVLSSGMSSLAEFDLAVKTLKENGCKDLVVLQCTTEYPCKPENVGLNMLAELRDRYNVPVGLSDHTPDYLGIPVAAAMLGATMYEKHFTLSRQMYGSDAQFALEPAELKQLVVSVRSAELAVSRLVDKDAFASTPAIKQMKQIFEKSVVAARAIAAGAVLQEADVAYKKPGDGIPARDFKKVIGKKLKKEVNKDYKFSMKDFV